VILNNGLDLCRSTLWYEPIYNVTKAALVMLSKAMSGNLSRITSV